MRVLHCCLIGLLLVLAGCQSTPPAPPPAPVVQSTPAPVQALLYQQHRDWRGVPYRMGGLSRAGVDCSGFVYLAFRDAFGIELPRHTAVQVAAGQPVPRHALRPGDLVFFQTGRNSRHVGIFIEGQQFLHASTEKGVMISRLDDRYWAGRFWKAVRVLP